MTLEPWVSPEDAEVACDTGELLWWRDDGIEPWQEAFSRLTKQPRITFSRGYENHDRLQVQ